MKIRSTTHESRTGFPHAAILNGKHSLPEEGARLRLFGTFVLNANSQVLAWRLGSCRPSDEGNPLEVAWTSITTSNNSIGPKRRISRCCDAVSTQMCISAAQREYACTETHDLRKEDSSAKPDPRFLTGMAILLFEANSLTDPEGQIGDSSTRFSGSVYFVVSLACSSSSTLFSWNTFVSSGRVPLMRDFRVILQAEQSRSLSELEGALEKCFTHVLLSQLQLLPF